MLQRDLANPATANTELTAAAADAPPASWSAQAAELGLALDQAQEQLRRFALMSDSVPVLMAYYEGDGLTCTYANRAYAGAFGLTPEVAVGRRLVDIIGADALRQIQPYIDRVLAERRTVTYVRALPASDGSTRWIEVSLVPHHGSGSGPAVAGAFVQISDISRYRVAEQALRESEERLLKFMDATVEGIAFHRDGVISDVNAPMAALLGYESSELVGRSVMEFVAPAHRARAEQGREHASELPYESALLDRQGGLVPVELIAREIRRDGQALRMVVVRDIRDRQAARARMQHLAEHDPLTGLRNRGAFMDALAEAIARHAEPAAPLALLFVDLDHFKRINDALGHLAGDALLRNVAERLLSVLRDGAVAGRFGGDEFVILLPAVADRAEAREAGLRLQAAMAEPVAWSGHSISATPTIGVALFPHDGGNADALLRHADMALYAGKAAGRAAVTLFEPAMAAAIESGQRLETQIVQGLAGGEFQLMLQPRLTLADGRLAGLQAVLRWRHPERGWLAPADFAGATQRRALAPLLDWALQEALRLAAHWQALGLSVPLTLNLSALVPQVGGLTAAVGRALARQALPPGALALELGESLLGDDRHGVQRTLDQLQQLGLPVLLDEFGAGGAPLAGLGRLPLAGLVLARALVAGLPDDPGAQAVVQAIITLARGLGLPACATGVSGGGQVEALRRAGCDLLQGSWYAPAMTAAEASAWLASRG